MNFQIPLPFLLTLNPSWLPSDNDCNSAAKCSRMSTFQGKLSCMLKPRQTFATDQMCINNTVIDSLSWLQWTTPITKQVYLTLRLKSTQTASWYFSRGLIDPDCSSRDLVSCNNLSTLVRMRKEQTDPEHNHKHKCRHVSHRKPRICWHVCYVAYLHFFRLNINFYVLTTLSFWSGEV